MAHQARVPDIPGQLVDHNTLGFLQDHVANLVESGSRRFPGAQPVSFTNKSMEMLENMNFWVCEKSDGVRVLVLILFNGQANTQDVFLLDRNDQYRQIHGLTFPHHDPKVGGPFIKDTILDGELVLDIDPRTGKETLRLYAFDCLVLNSQNLMKSNLQSRYGRLKSWIIEPFLRNLKANPQLKTHQPFEITCKEMMLAYHVDEVMNRQIPNLHHGHDGLIFTCSETGYVMGTDDKIMKWKPPEENTIDFRLQLKFPPTSQNPDEVDWEARPLFLLFVYNGDRRDESFFDELDVSDDEWEKMKESGEQFDDRIVECRPDLVKNTWKFMRFRDDKPHGNFTTIVDKILISIKDGVQIDEIMAKSTDIRTKWKAREAAKASRPPQTPSSAPQNQQHQQPQQQSHHSSSNSFEANLPRKPVAPAGIRR